MKRFICAALAAALLLPGALAVRAHAHDGDEDEQSEHQGPPEGGMREKMADRMKEKLGLSDDQATKLKDAMKAHGEASKPIMEKVKAGMEKLRDQVKSKAADADIKATLADLKTQRAAMQAEESKFHDSLAGFLTPTQQAKMLIGMMARHHAMMENRGGHGRWGGKRRGDGEDDHDGPKGDDGKKDDGNDD